MRYFFIAVTGLLIVLIGSTAGAKDNPLKSEITAYVVKIVNSKESLVKVDESVEPENIVEYKFTYTNHGKTDIGGLTVVGPIPNGTLYIDSTANSDIDAEVRFSIDGGINYLPAPIKVRRVKKNGEVIEVVVSAEEYTHIQWKPNVQIEKSGGIHEYRYRVRVK